MESNVMFSCIYRDTGGSAEQKPLSKKTLSAYGAAVLLFVIGCLTGLPFLFFLAVAIIVGSLFIKEQPAAVRKIQVTPTHLMAVEFNGRILQSFALKDIMAICAEGADTVVMKVKTRNPQTLEIELSECRFAGVGDCSGLIAAVKRQITGQSTPPQLPARQTAAVQQPQFPAQPQPRMLTEDEADRLHAAQHLLHQGAISKQQYSGVMKPAAPQPRPLTADELNAMNAADYQQRQAKIAQQLEMTQTEE